MAEDADVIVVGGGLAGLVATARSSMQETRHPCSTRKASNLGGQAFWSFGPDCFWSIPERQLSIKDSFELALQDWMGAKFDVVTRITGRGAGRKPTSRSQPARETRLAARDGTPYLSSGRLGGARRLWRDGPRQFGAALSCHLGHRAGHRRAVRAGARSREEAAG